MFRWWYFYVFNSSYIYSTQTAPCVSPVGLYPNLIIYKDFDVSGYPFLFIKSCSTA